MAGKDYYGILGVSRSASEREIKQAYSKMARRHHPDVNLGDKAAAVKFKRVHEVYEVLSDNDNMRRSVQSVDQVR